MSQNNQQVFRKLELKRTLNEDIDFPEKRNQNFQIENLNLLYNIQLIQGDFYGESFVNVQYELIVPDNWTLIKGSKSGISHTASTNISSSTKVPFNFCFSFLFETSDLTAIPQLIFYIFGVDFFGKPKILGYGKTLLYPNVNLRKNVEVFKPLPINKFSGIFGAIFGKKVQYKNPQDILGSNKGREYTRTKSIGEIVMQMESISKNWEDLGFFQLTFITNITLNLAPNLSKLRYKFQFRKTIKRYIKKNQHVIQFKQLNRLLNYNLNCQVFPQHAIYQTKFFDQKN